MNHNGEAEGIGCSYSVCSDSAILKVDWPHDSQVQHEVSHLFDADGHSSRIIDCIMKYSDTDMGINE